MITIDMQAIKAAIFKFNEEYVAKNGTACTGCCGYGNVVIKFGRKIKIRREMQELNMIDDRRSYDGTYSFNSPRVENDINVQSYAYNAPRESVVAKELQKQLEEYGVDVYNRSWVD